MGDQYKIVFSGPVGAGKTTAITALSDTDPVRTEQKATDETAQKKELTTVAMDYGSIRLDSGDIVHLYGTPGQQRFDFMWRILSDGAIGLIIVIDNSEQAPVKDLEAFLDVFLPYFSPNQIAVGINKISHRSRHQLQDYQQLLRDKGLSIPILEIDARDPEDVFLLVQALLLNIDPSLSELAG